MCSAVIGSVIANGGVSSLTIGQLVETRVSSAAALRRIPFRAMTFAIGTHELSAPVVLAPMAGVTNAPFREMCRKFAPGLVYVNEMAMATPVVHKNEIGRAHV